MKQKNNIQGFSIIEVLVGIFIFAMGIISIYMVIISTLNANYYNKNYIIATYLAKEQLELYKNIRDSNYKVIKRYDQIDPSQPYSVGTPPATFVVDTYYKIYNNFSSGEFPIKVDEITPFDEGLDRLGMEMQNYRLCLDGENRYVYDSGCSTAGLDKTNFYRYLKVEAVSRTDGTLIDEALKITSKVIWNQKGYHEFEVETIVTDWKRL